MLNEGLKKALNKAIDILLRLAAVVGVFALGAVAANMYVWPANVLAAAILGAAVASFVGDRQAHGKNSHNDSR